MQGTIAPPDEDIEVYITLRDSELARMKWNVILSGSTKGMEISVEDMN